MRREVDLTMSVCPSVRLTLDMCFPGNPDMIAARLFYIYVTYSPPFRAIEIQPDRSTNGWDMIKKPRLPLIFYKNPLLLLYFYCFFLYIWRTVRAKVSKLGTHILVVNTHHPTKCGRDRRSGRGTSRTKKNKNCIKTLILGLSYVLWIWLIYQNIGNF